MGPDGAQGMRPRGNILHLRSSEFFGGPERAIIGQCLSLDGFSLSVASFLRGRGPSPFLEECRRQGIETDVVTDSFPGDIRGVREIVRILRRRSIGLLVTHDYKANLFGLLACRWCAAVQIAHFRGLTSEDRKVKLYNAINWPVLRRMKRVLVVSKPARRLLVSHGVRPERIEVVFNAIRCDPLDSPAASPDEGPFRIVAAGRMSFEKGHDLLLHAVAAIRDRAPSFEVHLYGHGPEEGRLRRVTEELGIGEIVRFRGFVDDIKPVFRQADLMVLPSRSEGMPNVVLEAWSQGLGVLATTVGGVPEMIEHRESGLLVPGEDVAALAECMLSAIEDPERTRSYGVHGHNVARQRYDFSRQADLLAKVYAECLGGSRVGVGP